MGGGRRTERQIFWTYASFPSFSKAPQCLAVSKLGSFCASDLIQLKHSEEALGLRLGLLPSSRLPLHTCVRACPGVPSDPGCAHVRTHTPTHARAHPPHTLSHQKARCGPSSPSLLPPGRAPMSSARLVQAEGPAPPPRPGLTGWSRSTSCSSVPHKTGGCTSRAGAPAGTRGSGLCRRRLKSSKCRVSQGPGVGANLGVVEGSLSGKVWPSARGRSHKSLLGRSLRTDMSSLLCGTHPLSDSGDNGLAACCGTSVCSLKEQDPSARAL